MRLFLIRLRGNAENCPPSFPPEADSPSEKKLRRDFSEVRHKTWRTEENFGEMSARKGKAETCQRIYRYHGLARGASILILAFVFFSGCGSLKTLIRISKEQKEQQEYIELERRKFKILLKDIQKNRLKLNELSKQEVIKIYGEPIMEKNIDGKDAFLYREPLEFFPSQKVYLFFDMDGILINFEVKTEDAKK